MTESTQSTLTVLEIRNSLRRFDLPLATQRQKFDLFLGKTVPNPDQKTFERETSKAEQVIRELGGGGWVIQKERSRRGEHPVFDTEGKKTQRKRSKRDTRHNIKKTRSPITKIYEIDRFAGNPNATKERVELLKGGGGKFGARYRSLMKIVDEL